MPNSFSNTNFNNNSNNFYNPNENNNQNNMRSTSPKSKHYKNI